MADPIMHTVRWWWPGNPEEAREVVAPRETARDLQTALQRGGWTVTASRLSEAETEPYTAAHRMREAARLMQKAADLLNGKTRR